MAQASPLRALSPGPRACLALQVQLGKNAETTPLELLVEPTTSWYIYVFESTIPAAASVTT